MRLRLKKNLDDRARCCNEYYLPRYEGKNALVGNANPDFWNLAQIFGNNNPVCLEIGCGKGKFAVEYALLHPDENIIAVERLSNVIVEGAEKAKNAGLTNIRFLVQNASYLPHFISPHTIDRIFLNFSCPFPKQQYQKRRLTHPKFLAMYSEWLKNGGTIQQKTDNLPFFEFNAFSTKTFSSNIINSTFLFSFSLKNLS